MKHIPARKVAAAALTLTFAVAPAFAFAQTTSTTTPNPTISALEAQIKSLLQQLSALQQQMRQARGDQGEGSSTPEMPGYMMASSSMSMHVACPMPTRNLGIGSSGEDVKEVQQFLSEQGSSTLPTTAVTGFFGSMTQQALEKFQESNGVTSTGTLGPITRNLFAHRCAIGHENSDGNWDHASTTRAWPMPMMGSSSPMMPYMHTNQFDGSTTGMHMPMMPTIPTNWFNLAGSSTQPSNDQ